MVLYMARERHRALSGARSSHVWHIALISGLERHNHPARSSPLEVLTGSQLRDAMATLTTLPEDLLREVLRRLPRLEVGGRPIEMTRDGQVRAHESCKQWTLLSLASTSRAMRLVVARADEVWADVSRFRFGYAASSLREVVGHAVPEKQIHWTLRWILPHLAAHGRAAYARPTIKPAPDAEELSGGSWAGSLDPPRQRIDFMRLTRVSGLLLRLLAALETDVTEIPEHVDALIVPTNERMHSPGWGVADSVERKCGQPFTDWMHAALDRAGEPPGIKLRPGEVRTSPAFGDALQFNWLVHAVGIPWARFAKPEQRMQAIMEMVELFGRIFGAAAAAGANSIAIPAELAGDFPPAIMAAIAAAHAVREMLASGGTLRVALTGFSTGPEKFHTSLFEIARQEASRCLTCCDARHAAALDHRVQSIAGMAGMHQAMSAVAGLHM